MPIAELIELKSAEDSGVPDYLDEVVAPDANRGRRDVARKDTDTA